MWALKAPGTHPSPETGEQEVPPELLAPFSLSYPHCIFSSVPALSGFFICDNCQMSGPVSLPVRLLCAEEVWDRAVAHALGVLSPSFLPSLQLSRLGSWLPWQHCGCTRWQWGQGAGLLQPALSYARPARQWLDSLWGHFRNSSSHAGPFFMNGMGVGGGAGDQEYKEAGD